MTNKTQVKDDAVDLKADFEELRADVAELANSFKAFLAAQQTKAGTAASEAGEAASAVLEGENDDNEWQEFRRKLGEARLHSEQAIDDIGEEVAQHPLASLAVAFGVGYLAAKLLK
jgi:ElaB/YqjD/DUF883 family membrane-anchored ribosome-binding protein